MNGYNFTERVRRVLAMARDEAARLHHEYVGTEHMLLALTTEHEGGAAEVLREFAVDRETLRRRVEKVVRAGKPTAYPSFDLPYTSRAKKVLELSMTEARLLNHSYVGSEHLLLGLLAEAKGIAAQILEAEGVTLDAARRHVVRALDHRESQWPAPAIEVEELEAVKGKAVERVEVVLHYPDGRHFRGTFGSPRDAAAFLRIVGPGG